MGHLPSGPFQPQLQPDRTPGISQKHYGATPSSVSERGTAEPPRDEASVPTTFLALYVSRPKDQLQDDSELPAVALRRGEAVDPLRADSGPQFGLRVCFRQRATARARSQSAMSMLASQTPGAFVSRSAARLRRSRCGAQSQTAAPRGVPSASVQCSASLDSVDAPTGANAQRVGRRALLGAGILVPLIGGAGSAQAFQRPPPGERVFVHL